jgi:hypothetical protein
LICRSTGANESAPFDQVADSPFTHLDSQQVPHHLTGAGQGQQLLFDQIHDGRSYIGSILDGRLHPGGKWRHGDMLAVGTLFLLGPIFPHEQMRRRQIHHLTASSSTRCNRAQVVLARFAPFYLLLDDLIRRGGELQARSPVSWLPSRLLLARIARKLFGFRPKRSEDGGR